MSEIYRFTKAQYESFRGSKYYGMTYKDKMLMEVILHRGDNIFVKVGEGIDLDFYTDIFKPFINGDETNDN
jgi:hypothetical protein